MNVNLFTNTVWCDLSIVVLKIFSYHKWDSTKFPVMDENPDKTKSLPVVNIYICDADDEIFNKASSYREKTMLKGLYLGHHFGEIANLKVIDDYNIALCHHDPAELIRWYISKYVLNIFALKEHIMYLKGGAVEYKGKAFLILGRGGSGKTEMINVLCDNDAHFISNTHLLIDSLMVRGVNTSIRVRNNGEDKFVKIQDLHGCNTIDSAPIGGIFWVKFREDGDNHIRKMDSDELFYNMQFFSEATINWEMKEDIADYCKSDPEIFKKRISEIYDRLREIAQIDSYYLNLNIHSCDGLNKTLKLMDELALSGW